jgi:hypothetical protein
MTCILCGCDLVSGAWVNGKGPYCYGCSRTLTSPPAGPIGWVCPVCGRGVAPWQGVCGCGPHFNTITTTQTGRQADC